MSHSVVSSASGSSSGSAYRDLRRRLEASSHKSENRSCCDCAAPLKSNTTWATLLRPPPGADEPFGAFVCYNCADSHKALGAEVCRVRSVTLEEWTEADVMAMERGGNKKTNAVWEAKITFDTARPNAQSERPQRDTFLRKKYVERAWYSESLMKKQLQQTKASFGNFALKASSSDTASTLKPGSTRRLGNPVSANDDEDIQDYTLPLGGKIARRMSLRNLMDDVDQDQMHSHSSTHGDHSRATPSARRPGRRSSLVGSASARNTAEDLLHEPSGNPDAQPHVVHGGSRMPPVRTRSNRRASLTGAITHRGVGRTSSSRNNIKEMGQASARAAAALAAASVSGMHGIEHTSHQGVAARRRAARRASVGGMAVAPSNSSASEDTVSESKPRSSRGLGRSSTHSTGTGHSEAGEPPVDGRRRRVQRRSSVSGSAPNADSSYRYHNRQHQPTEEGTSSRSLVSMSSDDEDDGTGGDDLHGAPSSTRSLTTGSGGPPGLRRRVRGHRVRGGAARSNSIRSTDSEDGTARNSADTGYSDEDGGSNEENDHTGSRTARRVGIQKPRSARFRGGGTHTEGHGSRSSRGSVNQAAEHDEGCFQSNGVDDDDGGHNETALEKDGSTNDRRRACGSRRGNRTATRRPTSSRRLAAQGKGDVSANGTDSTANLTDESEHSRDDRASALSSRREGMSRTGSIRRMRSGRRASMQ